MAPTSYVHQVPNGGGGFMFLHVGTLFGLRDPAAGCDLNLLAIGDGLSIFKIELRHKDRATYKHSDMGDDLDGMEKLLHETLLPSDPQRAPTVMTAYSMGCNIRLVFENPKTGFRVATVDLRMIDRDERVPVGDWELKACRERDASRAELITARKKMLEAQTYAGELEERALDAEVREISYHMKVKVNNHDVNDLQRKLSEQAKVIETLRARLQLQEEKDHLSGLRTAVSASEQRIRELEEKVEKGSEGQNQGTVEACPETLLVEGMLSSEHPHSQPEVSTSKQQACKTRKDGNTRDV